MSDPKTRISSASAVIVKQRRSREHQHRKRRRDSGHFVGVLTGAIKRAGVMTELVDYQVDIPSAGCRLVAEPSGTKIPNVYSHDNRIITVRATARGVGRGRIIRPTPGGDPFVQYQLAEKFGKLAELLHCGRNLLLRQRNRIHVMSRP